jgi:hypothetical protein
MNAKSISHFSIARSFVLAPVDACAPLVWPVLASRGHPVASPRLDVALANGVTSVE